MSAHLTIEDLAGLRSAANDDPRRTHLAQCPHCRLWSEGFAEFEHPTAPLPEHDLVDAEARLEQFLEREILRAPQAALAPGRAPVVESPTDTWTAPTAGSPPPSRLWRLSLAPAWALAAVLVVAGGALLLRGGRRDETVVLRQQPGTRRVAGTEVVRVEAPQRQPDGSWTVRWNPVPEADAYQVHLYGTDLQESKVLPPGSATAIRLSSADLPAASAAEFVFVEVRALHRGDPIGASQLIPLRLR